LTRAPGFFFLASIKAWATLILLWGLGCFSSLDLDPLDDEGLFFFEEELVCDLLRLVLDYLVLFNSIGQQV